MDADDISMPDRLERQAQALAQDPKAGIVGSLFEVIDSSGRKLRGAEPWRLARSSWLSPFPHGSMMVRRDLFDAVGGYRDQCEFWEDLDFLVRASAKTRILVIPSPLYRWRHSVGGTRLASEQVRVENAIDLRYRSLARIRGQRSYDDLLRRWRRRKRRAGRPRVFVSIGSLALWAQRRPRVARRFFKRARLRLDVASVVATAWVGWASISPHSLRAFMRLQSRFRNLRGLRGLQSDEAVEWRPPRETAATDRMGKRREWTLKP